MTISKNVTVRACAVAMSVFGPLLLAAPAHTQTLYGAVSGATSPLYSIDPATGVGTAIGPIGIGVGGLAIHPITRVLYGVTSPGAPGPRQLLRIDLTTGAGTVVGPIGLGNLGVADISFRSDGVLFGWSENSDDLITINLTTGAGTIVANAAISTRGSGLSFNANDILYLAGSNGNGALRTVNSTTGLTTIVATLTGAPLPASPIPAMAFHPVTQVLYGVNRTTNPGTTSKLITIDTGTGAVTTIGDTVARLDALAFDLAPATPPPASPPPPAQPTDFPPSIVTELPDRIVPQNGSLTVPFAITGAVIHGALRTSVNSSNPALLPVSPSTLNVTCTESGNCALFIAPADGRAGLAQVTVTVTDGYYSTSKSFTVTVSALRPSPPAVVLANVVGSGVVLTWTAPESGQPVAYAIAWGTSTASNLPVQLVPGSATRYEFSTLPSGTYSFRLYAVGTGELSAASPSASASISGSGAPGPPLALQTSSSARGFTAAWTAPPFGAPPTVYEVQVGTSLGSNDVVSATTDALAQTAIAGSGSYWTRVRAAAGGAPGAWSSSIHTRLSDAACAGAPGPPILLPVTTTSGRVTFTWWPGAGVAETYQILIEPGAGLEPIAALATGSSGTSLVWAATSGSFAARAVAVNACGRSVRSNEVAFTIEP